jgi:hypothetical protein
MSDLGYCRYTEEWLEERELKDKILGAPPRAITGVEPIAGELWAELCAMLNMAARTRGPLFEPLWRAEHQAPPGAPLPWKGRLDRAVAAILECEAVPGLRGCLSKLAVRPGELRRFKLHGKVLQTLLAALAVKRSRETLLHAERICITTLRALDRMPLEGVTTTVVDLLTDPVNVSLSDREHQKIEKCRNYLLKHVSHAIMTRNDVFDGFKRLPALLRPMAVEQLLNAKKIDQIPYSEYPLERPLHCIPITKNITDADWKNCNLPDWAKVDVKSADGTEFHVIALVNQHAANITGQYMRNCISSYELPDPNFVVLFVRDANGPMALSLFRVAHDTGV